MLVKLLTATRRSNYHVIVQLLNENPSLVNEKSDRGITPIFEAVSHGKIPTVKLLLSYKADINSTDSNGNSLLHIACMLGSRDTVSCLIMNHIDIYIKNDAGETCFDIAEYLTTFIDDCVKKKQFQQEQLKYWNHEFKHLKPTSLTSSSRSTSSSLNNYGHHSNMPVYPRILSTPDHKKKTMIMPMNWRPGKDMPSITNANSKIIIPETIIIPKKKMKEPSVAIYNKPKTPEEIYNYRHKHNRNNQQNIPQDASTFQNASMRALETYFMNNSIKPNLERIKIPRKYMVKYPDHNDASNNLNISILPKDNIGNLLCTMSSRDQEKLVNYSHSI